MTKIQVISDLHLDLGGWFPRRQDTVGDVVVVAGDVSWVPERFADALWEIQAPVVAVLGNHEHYGKCIESALERYQASVEPLGRVQLLEKGRAVIGGVRFLGATLWGGYGSDRDCERARMEQGCFRNSLLVRKGHPIGPETIHARHCDAVTWLEAELGIPHSGPTVVVTHFPPTRTGCPADCKDLPGLAGDLESLILRHQPALWVHGHLHNSCDYSLGRTRVICNPAGCAKWRNPAFNPRLCVSPNALVGLPYVAAG